MNSSGEIFCMKKISNPLLTALLFIEVIAAVSFINQLEKQPIFFMAVGGIALIAGGTVYFLAKNIADYYKDTYSAFAEMLNEYKKEMNANNEKQYELLTSSFVEQSDRICDRTSEAVNALGCTVHNEMEGVLVNIKVLLNKFGEQVDNTKQSMELVISDVKSALDHQISTTEFRTSNLQNGINETFEGGMKDMNTLLGSIQAVFDKRLSDIHAEYEKMLSDVKTELVKHTGVVSGSVSENAKILSENLDRYSQNVSTNLQQIWNENVETLETSCEAFLEKTSETLEHRNLELMNKHTDYSHERIQEIADQYDEIISEHISCLNKEVQTQLSVISEQSKVVVEELAEKLRSYSDSFVDKSAQAIANVQKDNNLKLQEMCESYSDFSRDSRAFAEHCDNNNAQTNASIERLMQQNNEFLANLQQVSDSSVLKMDKVLNDYVDHMIQRVEKLNVDSSDRYYNAMEQYRDNFVELNAHALSNVQKDNVDAISNAHNKIVELAENVEKTNEQMNRLGKGLMLMLEETKKIIAQGNETASEKQEMFNEGFDQNVGNMKKVLTEKLIEYNNTFDELKKQIGFVLEEVRQNTKTYNSTLKTITDSQKAMNSLTSKDIQLLERLVKE